jgi:beta-N-acetylhexosaminidase
VRRAASLMGVAVLLAGCGGPARGPRTVGGTGAGDGAPGHPNGPRLTVRQAVGQRFVFPFAGTRPPRALERRIARGEAAGVILFARNITSVAQVRAMVQRLQQIPRPKGLDAPLLVMVDHEGGAVRRLPGPPGAGAAQTPDAAAARANGRAAAGLLRRAGINVDLAPVVDVARPGAALEREGRTYGRDPLTVTERAGAFAAGLRAGGVAPVLKHFPGFGAATINTDDGAAAVDLDLATLRALDAVPYRRIRAPAVMVSTAIYPRVDPRPAAFSRRWVTGELRERLGFHGVTITDDLETPAVTRFGTPAQLAYYAVRAGVDLPLFAHHYAAAARAAAGLERGVRTGALPRAQVDAGVRRVLAWRGRLAGSAPR